MWRSSILTKGVKGDDSEDHQNQDEDPHYKLDQKALHHQPYGLGLSICLHLDKNSGARAI